MTLTPTAPDDYNSHTVVERAPGITTWGLLIMSRKKKDKEQFKLNINESLMFAIQGATSQTTYQIVEYFYNMMHKQKKEILDSPAAVERGERRTELVTKKSYGFYPNTKIYFVASTNYKDVVDEFDNGHFGTSYGPSYKVWECTVTIPRNMIEFDHNKLKDIMAESVLLGAGVIPEVGSPHEKPRRIRDAVSNLTGKDEVSETE